MNGFRLVPDTGWCVFVWSLTVIPAIALAEDGAPARTAEFQQRVQPLLTAHCIACHGAETQEAGLRLDTLPWDATSAGNQRLWTRVLDRVTTGDMPPDSEPRPPAAAVQLASQHLQTQLHAASLHQQQTQGRVPLRRLNRTEYEHTVQELVGTTIGFQELLPDENSAGGFDNQAVNLELSAAHFLMYQTAADVAVRSMIPMNPPLPILERRTGRKISEIGANFRQTLDRSCRLDGDALIIYRRLTRYGLACTPNVNGKGTYRVRLSASAVGAGRESVPAALMVVDRNREPPVLRDSLDIAAGAPQVYEFDYPLEDGQAFVIDYLSNWDIRGFRKPITEYTGPGIRLEWLEIEGPIDPFPTPAFRELFGDAELVPTSVAKAQRAGRRVNVSLANRNIWSWRSDPLEVVAKEPHAAAEPLIRKFVQRAFRRPVEEPLQQHYVDLVQRKLAAGASFQDAMIYGYKAILTSPHFLFLLEPGTAPRPAETSAAETSAAETSATKAAALRLDDFALASRLSYFLWKGPPDEELLQLAAAGKLSQSEVLSQQVDRLLNAPQSRRFTTDFTGQWLDLRKMDDTIPDPYLYGDFDGMLLWSMPRETWFFFEELLRTDDSLLNFVDSEWSMLNDRLAEHYGIPNVTGHHFRRVTLPASAHRGGVLTHASVLKVTADGTTTSPVLRGKWVLEKILGQPPSPPPPDIPAIEPDIRGATTIREQLEKHREIASCASCHRHIDPPGFALESFDPIGGYREFYRASSRTTAGVVMLPNSSGRPVYRGRDVEVGGETHDGKPFRGIDDYQRLLLEDPDQIARNLTGQLLAYATGAEVQFADREVVSEIVTRLKAKNYGFRTLIHEIVHSRPFLHQ